MIKPYEHTLGDLLFTQEQSVLRSQSRSRELFGREWKNLSVFELPSCASSLDVAWDLISRKQMSPGDSVLCLEQTRGRGRMRRTWLSPAGNIHAALYLPPARSEEMNRILPVVVGYCILITLRKKGMEVFLKWPNDLVMDDRKIGGILIEEKKGSLLAGVGLNLKSYPEPDELRGGRLMDAGSLNEAWPGSDPLLSWAELVYWSALSYDSQLQNFSSADFEQEINSCLWKTGHKVRFQRNGELIEGYLQGMNRQGEIVLDCFGRLERIREGRMLP